MLLLTLFLPFPLTGEVLNIISHKVSTISSEELFS